MHSFSPVLYQYLTDGLFHILIETKFLEPSPPTSEPLSSSLLSLVKQNALRYVGEYIIQKLKERTSNQEELSLLLGLLHNNDTSESELSESWINEIDRGGLWHKNDQTYGFFYVVEEALQGQIINITQDLYYTETH